MNSVTSFDIPNLGSVTTVHILKGGELVHSLDEYQKVEDRFSWVNRHDIVSKILRLRPLTDLTKKSIIAIYEEGYSIREFINVDPDFKPLPFC
ncbi:MAG: hypothetical protein C5B52_08520 [Bacteroidetes bacterium]|nr:MAG: hypothetical protein C5B52_08520 [Bacteroidota bacterium]